VDHLNLVHLVNDNRCPCRLELCSALMANGKIFDKSIKKGLSWLLRYITENFSSLKERVDKDVEVSQKSQKDMQDARKEKVRKIREEREREERARGIYVSDEENDSHYGKKDPFKPLDKNSFKKKPEDEKYTKNKNITFQDKVYSSDLNKLSTRSENSLAIALPYKPSGSSPRPGQLPPTSSSIGNLPNNSSRSSQLPRIGSIRDSSDDRYDNNLNREKSSSLLKKGSSLGTIYDDKPYNGGAGYGGNKSNKNAHFTDEDSDLDRGYNSRTTSKIDVKPRARFSDSPSSLQDQSRSSYQSTQNSTRSRNQLYS